MSPLSTPPTTSKFVDFANFIPFLLQIVVAELPSGSRNLF